MTRDEETKPDETKRDDTNERRGIRILSSLRLWPGLFLPTGIFNGKAQCPNYDPTLRTRFFQWLGLRPLVTRTQEQNDE